jgi:DNA-binding GntR family transcriptional regulator
VELWLNHMQKRHLVITHSTREDTVISHAHLLDVLRSGDTDRAAKAMHEHIVSRRLMLPEQA